MPRSDDDPDFLQTFTSEGEGKSKSTRIAPLEVGRNGAPVRVFRQEELDPDALESPPSGVRFLLTDDTGELVQKNPDGTVTGVSGAPEDAEYVTTTESTALPNDTAHSTLTGADLHDPAQHGSTHEQGGTDELDVTGLSGDLADAQDPKAHQSTHQDGGADELQVDTLAGDNGAAGEVLQTDGSALSFGAVGGNVPNWEEDPNSPVTGSNTGSVTVSLASPLVYARVIVKARYDSSGSFFNISMRVNGDTGTNYDFEGIGGSTTTAREEWVLTQADDKTGTWAGSVDLNANSTGIACIGPLTKSARGSSQELLAGTNRSVSAPLNSVTAFDGGLDSFEEISMAVYGIEL